MPSKYGIPSGKSKGAPTYGALKPQPQRGRPSRDGRPLLSHLILSRYPGAARRQAQAGIFILSVATATRFEIGCANSPNILSIRSVEREPSAIIVSNAVRA